MIEREGTWFRRALSQAHTLVPLGPFVPAGTPDPIQYLFDDLYRDMRSAMSHAKSGHKILLPQNDADRAAVTASLSRLISLYLKLAKAHLGKRRGGGGMFSGAFRAMVTPQLEVMTVFASDDESPMNPSDTVPNPADGHMCKMSAGPLRAHVLRSA